MISFVIDFFAIFGVLFCTMICVDVIFRFIRISSRHRIVLFKDMSDWKHSVTNCAKRWVKKMPIIPLKDEERMIILDIVKKQYKHSSLQGWQYAELLSGVYLIDPNYNKKCSFFNDNELKEIDEGYVIYQEWKNEIINDEEISNIMNEYIKLIIQHTRPTGLIEYREGFGDICIVDTIAFVCPVLIKWGMYTSNEQLIYFSIRQIEEYYKHAYISECGLYAHAYNGATGVVCESIGWGRGTGWYLLGILYSYQELKNTDYSEKLLKLIIEAADNILKFQQKDGGWCTQLVSQWNYDSSVTAIFGYFLSEVYKIDRNKSKRYLNAANAALEKLKCVTRKDGAIEYCEGACHGVGKYSKLYTISPFTQGMTLKLIYSLNI